MSDSVRGQVNRDAAEVYEALFLPALFAQWVSTMIDAAHVMPGQRVLDVACGTGVLARAVAERVGARGHVEGLDANPAMLAVARQQAPAMPWVAGAAEALPYPDARFDAVVSQFGLMFFDDRPAALREMLRVLRPGGQLAVAVWDTLEHTPGYAAMAALLERLFGAAVAASLQFPYVLGDLDVLRDVFAAAGLTEVHITTHEGSVRFPSLHDWVYTDVKGWTAADAIDAAGLDRLVAEAEHELRRFVTSDGRVAFSAPAHIVTASRR